MMVVNSYLKVLWKHSCFLHKSYSCISTSTFFQDVAKLSWTLNVQPFWKLTARLTNCDLDIKSSDPIESLDGNKLVVEVYHNRNTENSENHDINIVADDLKKTILLTSNLTLHHTVKVLTPPAFDLDVRLLGDSSLSISNIESIALSTYVENGDIKLNNIKAQHVISNALNGTIISTKVLQGILKLQAKNIKADKIQSPEAKMIVNDGKMTLKDVYTEKFFATNHGGDVTVQSVHGDSRIMAGCGNIEIGTQEGSLNADTQHGNVNIHIAVPERVYISTVTGNIFISIPKDLEVTMNLTAANITSKSLDIAKKSKSEDGSYDYSLGQCIKDGPRIRGIARQGTIELQHSSWMQRITQFQKEFMTS